MEKTFGVKDFVLFVLLILLIVLVVLSMVQFDRQWNEVQSIQKKLEQHTNDLQAIQKQLASGIAMRPGATTQQSAAGNDLPPAFKRVQDARDKADFAQGDWLIYGQLGRLASITPFIGGDVNSATIINNVQETLCNRDPDTLEWQGLIAEKWTTKDNTAEWEAFAEKRRQQPLTEAEVLKEPDCPPEAEAADRAAYVKRRMAEGVTDDTVGMDPACPPAAIYTFTLRPNITFSDGQPLTPDDVVFTYEFTMNPAVNAPRDRAYLSRLRSVKKTGDREVTIELRVPYFEGFNLAAGLQVMPKHFYGKYSPEDYNKSTGLLLGSGPYMLADPTGWAPGKPMELIRNPRYWGVQSGIDKLVFREFTNQVAQETAFRNREIDVLGCPPERYVQMTADKPLVERTQHFEYQSVTGGYNYIAWNQFRYGKPTMFAKKGVRQAMSLLTNADRILKEIRLGYGQLSTGPFNPVSKQNDSALKPWPFDPDRAAKLLAEAGFKDNGGGVLVDADGKPLSFKLTYPSGNPTTVKMVLLLRDLYARVKIRMEPDEQEWSVFKTRLQNREFDAITLGWSAGVETDLFQMFHSSQISDGGDNFMSYRSPELDKTISQARRTLDEAVRMKLWQKCHQIIYEDQPYTFLFFPKSLVFMDKRLKNVQVNKSGMNNDSEWYVARPDQRWTK